ncbi:tRNA-dihydrouridine synthase 1 [Pleurostoma richardsiae]|uniref:tRNA-dihydrouridine(16/17) synthase [NAD(P)(+)] n=1 Tax=Pleurostoma richardsiae TaxID=41990 RepID=A0AA38RXJ1_9PEZI|nr:tRNA-dihydrouridine synthase 1 [Pleurostoma richardsiae]
MASETATVVAAAEAVVPEQTQTKKKLHGRAFYESIGSPKHIVAPMVDQSEFAWRMLSRSFLSPSERSSLLAYSPMFHARLFATDQKYRDSHFQPTRSPLGKEQPKKPSSEPAPSSRDDTPYLDGNPAIDRPLFVQFCANDPASLLAAAQLVAPHCDAVDLNLGCPQGIARKGHYGAFLQEDQALIHEMVRTLHEGLPVPVTAKIRILDTREATLAYARNVLSAGASILTVHGRRREQKGHMTGVADWGYIRYLRDNLPPETVIFANGNILQHGDVERCLEATGADGVMSAEGNLSDPGVFAEPPAPGEEGREYWRGRDGRGGWRVDAVMRRYLDILHKYVLHQDPPARRPLFLPGDDEAWIGEQAAAEAEADAEEPARKKRKKDGGGGGKEGRPTSPNLIAVQPHLFHMLRHFVSRHTDVRDALAKARMGDLANYERILAMVERRVAEGLLEYERTDGASFEADATNTAFEAKAKQAEEAKEKQQPAGGGEGAEEDEAESSAGTIRRCKRPWWVAQPIVRPLPKEAVAKGALQLSKKEKMKLEEEQNARRKVDDIVAQPQKTGGEKVEGAAELEKTTSYPVSELVAG